MNRPTDNLYSCISSFQIGAKQFLTSPSTDREAACLRQLGNLRDAFSSILFRSQQGSTCAEGMLYCVVCPFATRLLLLIGFPRVAASMAALLALFLRYSLPVHAHYSSA